MKNIDNISEEERKILRSYMFFNGIPDEWKYQSEITQEIYNSFEFAIFTFVYRLKLLIKEARKTLKTAWKKILGAKR